MNTINDYHLNIKQIIRRKKHNGENVVGDKLVFGRRPYKSYINRLSSKYKNNIISISNNNGVFTKINTTKLLNPTINMVGFSFNDRISNLQQLFRNGRLKLGKSSLSFKKLIIT